MKFKDVPNLAKFERFAQENLDHEIIQHAYRMVEARLESVPDAGHNPMAGHGPEEIMSMKDRCEAVEETTRIIWACAAATDNINPPMWENGAPTFENALEYIWNLPDLEWMDVTHKHRIVWEKAISLRPNH
ncbi:MAG: hypothetical protein AAF558_02020 [Verrucomicrobiota bacterium]